MASCAVIGKSEDMLDRRAVASGLIIAAVVFAAWIIFGLHPFVHAADVLGGGGGPAGFN
jgi:hypothetical protein